jgi:hypothetical protein
MVSYEYMAEAPMSGETEHNAPLIDEEPILSVRVKPSPGTTFKEEVAEDPMSTRNTASDPSRKSGAHQWSFQADAETARILQELRPAFGLTNDRAIICRALALAGVIARAAQGADSIQIRNDDGRTVVVILRE